MELIVYNGLMIAFFIVLANKLGVFDYTEARFNLKRCFFCLSFWLSLIVYAVLVAFNFVELDIVYAIRFIMCSTIIATFFSTIVYGRN